MTLNRMYHCVPRIISGLSQISGLRPKRDDGEDRDGKQQVGGKGGEELGDRLDRLGRARGRSPIQTPSGTQTSGGERDQHDDAEQGDGSRGPTPRREVVPAEPAGHDDSALRRAAAHAATADTPIPDHSRRSAPVAAAPVRQPAGDSAAAGRPRSRSQPRGSGRRTAGAAARRGAKQPQHPGARRRPPRRSARSGTCRPRRPAGGTAAGRRARMTTSMVRMAQPMARQIAAARWRSAI